MLALGAQQTGQSISLFLRATDREKIMQIMVVAARLSPLLAEVGDHYPNLRLHFVLLIILS